METTSLQYTGKAVYIWALLPSSDRTLGYELRLVWSCLPFPTTKRLIFGSGLKFTATFLIFIFWEEQMSFKEIKAKEVKQNVKALPREYWQEMISM